MNWYLKAFQQYADFGGRARRMEYWMFSLINSLVISVLALLGSFIGTGFELLYGVYFLIALVPSVAVSVRRLHDVNKSGWMLLVSFIPIVGWIWFFILTVTDSYPGENQYGSNPKGL